MAKAPNENGSDGEGRRLGEQMGLDIKSPADFRKLVSYIACKTTMRKRKTKKIIIRIID